MSSRNGLKVVSKSGLLSENKNWGNPDVRRWGRGRSELEWSHDCTSAPWNQFGLEKTQP
jgi:hypothetical protein